MLNAGLRADLRVAIVGRERPQEFAPTFRLIKLLVLGTAGARAIITANASGDRTSC